MILRIKLEEDQDRAPRFGFWAISTILCIVLHTRDWAAVGGCIPLILMTFIIRWKIAKGRGL